MVFEKSFKNGMFVKKEHLYFGQVVTMVRFNFLLENLYFVLKCLELNFQNIAKLQA